MSFLSFTGGVAGDRSVPQERPITCISVAGMVLDSEVMHEHHPGMPLSWLRACSWTSLAALLAASACASSGATAVAEGGTGNDATASSGGGGASGGGSSSGAPSSSGASSSGVSSSGASLPDASSSDGQSSGPADAAIPDDAPLLGDSGLPRSFTVTNDCTQTIWAAALPASTFPGEVVEMAPGYSFQVGVDNGWSGRIWGKVQCTTQNGKLACAGDAFPSSLAELTLTKTLPTGLDFYDVSLVDGFNLPIEIVALGHTPDAGHPYDCGDPSCAQNLNATCPQVLQDEVNGQVIACANDECKVLADNDASSPDCIYPNQYTKFFKDACPTAYSYPYDDPTSTFTCKGLNDYAIVFCP